VIYEQRCAMLLDFGNVTMPAPALPCFINTVGDAMLEQILGCLLFNARCAVNVLLSFHSPPSPASQDSTCGPGCNWGARSSGTPQRTANNALIYTGACGAG